MKTTLLTGVASVALAWSAFGQDPTATPLDAAPIATTPVAVASASPSSSAKDDLESRINRKVKHGGGVHIDLGPSRSEHHHSSDSDDDWGGLIAIPIVGIIFGTLFSAPVLIVGVILLFNYMRQRSLHRTVRMMVEKGQAVPPALFAPPAVIRARSDMRRGVVLVMVGIGLMLFLAAVNDWEGGAWTLGLIPFLIGAGHLLIWKFEGGKPSDFKPSTDNPPPLP